MDNKDKVSGSSCLRFTGSKIKELQLLPPWCYCSTESLHTNIMLLLWYTLLHDNNNKSKIYFPAQSHKTGRDTYVRRTSPPPGVNWVFQIHVGLTSQKVGCLNFCSQGRKRGPLKQEPSDGWRRWWWRQFCYVCLRISQSFELRFKHFTMYTSNLLMPRW